MERLSHETKINLNTKEDASKFFKMMTLLFFVLITKSGHFLKQQQRKRKYKSAYPQIY